MPVEIRTHSPAEWSDVAALIDRAFAPDGIARQLADWLHASAGWIGQLSLVAVDADGLVGHVMLTQLPLVTADGPRPVLYLSPLSVDPARRGCGTARALVSEVLQRAARRAEPLVFLEGSPSMYPKFGFQPAAAFGIEPPSDLVPPAAFQLVTLPSYRPGLRGRLAYPDYFYEVGAVGP